ncbi:hypothetical protein R1flu_027108 [Riccia fluitans]|uniref:Uncharacterized protein n=1 Tax=Riccia fluitans TaxID=41844 RepID=A0ABD1XI04_9MARC
MMETQQLSVTTLQCNRHRETTNKKKKATGTTDVVRVGSCSTKLQATTGLKYRPSIIRSLDHRLVLRIPSNFSRSIDCV